MSSADTAREREEAFEAARSQEAEFLFLAPEQLAKEDVLARVRELRPSVIAVDEAHCVSSWGHDFRPDYLRLGEFIDALGHPRVVALTATASPPVREDIVARLRMRAPRVIVRGFARPNIFLEVVRAGSAEEKREAVLLRAATGAKPGILYTGTRRESEEYARELADLGLAAAAYHGGMRARERDEVQRTFMAGELDVIVATSAFGMGIDKPDIHFVVHATVPDSPDSYYQEAGRCGRDGHPALAVLFYRPEDLGMRRFFSPSPPDLDEVTRVAGIVQSADTVDRKGIAEETGLGPRKLGRILNLLNEVPASADPQHRAECAVELAEAGGRLERSRIEMMRGYAETLGCRRQFLLGYFGEDDATGPCGNCDTCRSGSATHVDDQQPDDVPYEVQSRVRHRQFGDGIVMSYEGGKVTVLFEEAGYRTLALDAVLREGLLDPA